MTACGDVQLLLGAFEDGELRPREMEKVAFHVVGCDVCRRALEDYRALGTAIRETTVLPSLDGFTRLVMARIEHDGMPLRSRLREFWESLGRFGSIVQIAGVAAASAALTLIVIGPSIKDGMHRAVPILTMETLTHPVRAPGIGAEARANFPQNQSIPNVTPVGVVTDPSPEVSGESDEADAVGARESQEVVSELSGGSGPSVAVWDQPRTGTTVVWVQP